MWRQNSDRQNSGCQNFDRHISDRRSRRTITVWEPCQQSGFNNLIMPDADT